MCDKLHQYSYNLYMLRKTVNLTTLVTAYHGLVSATPKYGIIFQGNATAKMGIYSTKALYESDV